MLRLLKIDAVCRLRAEGLAWRKIAVPLVIAYIVCLTESTSVWLGSPAPMDLQPSVTSPLSVLLPASYIGKNIVLMIYMLMLLGAARLSLKQNPFVETHVSVAYANSHMRAFWKQGFGWFVHTILLCQIAVVPLLSPNLWVKALGALALVEVFVLAAVPAILAVQTCELIDAIVLAHKQAFWPQIRMQAQLWAVVGIVAVLWLGFVFLLVYLFLPSHVFMHYHSRTLAIAAQMLVVAALPLHAFASVRFVQEQLGASYAAEGGDADVAASDATAR